MPTQREGDDGEDMNGAYGEGLAAVELVHQWVEATWPYAVAILGFIAGYIVGGIVQRG